MRTLSAVCVHDDLAACKTSIAMRTSDHELSCRVHVEDMVTLEEGCCLWGESLDEHRKKDVLHVLADLRLHCLVNALLSILCAAVSITHVAESCRSELVVLSRNHDCMYAYGLVCLAVVLDCEL